MTEKYKIYLSEETKTRLINDAELFEFTKKDGSVNLNAFLKALIINYFEQYRLDCDKLLNNIIDDMTSITLLSVCLTARIAPSIFISGALSPPIASSARIILLCFLLFLSLLFFSFRFFYFSGNN